MYYPPDASEPWTKCSTNNAEKIKIQGDFNVVDWSQIGNQPEQNRMMERIYSQASRKSKTAVSNIRPRRVNNFGVSDRIKPQFNKTNADDWTMNSSYTGFKRLMSANKNLKSMEGVKETIMKLHSIKDESYKIKESTCRQTENFSYSVTNSNVSGIKSRPFSANIGGLRRKVTKNKEIWDHMKHTHIKSIDEI